MSYKDFLDSKRLVVCPAGFKVDEQDINPMLFDWQRAITRWAIAKGRCALFLDTGRGAQIQDTDTSDSV
jgi:hypothetical protein